MKSLIKRPVLFNNFFSKPYLVDDRCCVTTDCYLQVKAAILLEADRMFPLIQLPRKSEVTFGCCVTSSKLRFPLIQLPRKSEAQLASSRSARAKMVSINSTSEEVRSGNFIDSGSIMLLVSINSTSEEVRSY